MTASPEGTAENTGFLDGYSNSAVPTALTLFSQLVPSNKLLG